MAVRFPAANHPESRRPRATVEDEFERFRDGGDTRALAGVFDALAPDLLLVAAHLGRDPAEAEDLLQSTFVTAIERRHAYEPGRPLRSWLIGILAIEHRRQRRRDARTPNPERTSLRSVPDPGDAAAAAEFVDAMERALARMPAHYREPLNLRLLHGLSAAEIAHASGCPPATIKTRLQRGLALLRRTLPAGLSPALAVAALPERGLAAVRESILLGARRTITPTATAAATPTVVAGFLVVKQLSLAALVITLIAAGWWANSSSTSITVPTADSPLNAPRVTNVAAPVGQPTAPGDADQRTAAALTREPATTTAIPTTTLRVRLVWADGGAPVVNQRVLVARVEEPRAAATIRTTDEEGSITIEGPEPGIYRFTRQGWQRDVEAVRGEVVEATLRLDGFILVEGIVLDDQARPIFGAGIWLQNSGERRQLTTTAVDGTFATRLSAGGHLWAEAPNHLPSTARPIGTTKGVKHALEIQLDLRGHWLAGQVVSAANRPVAGARIAIETDRAQGIIRGRAGDQQLARPPLLLTADENGRFETGRAPAGARRMIASATGHGAVTVELNLPTQQPMTVQLAQPATISGTMLDAQGSPLPNGRVALQWIQRFDGIVSIHREFLTHSTQTDSQGQYRLTGLPAGKVNLLASSGSLPRVRHELALTPGQNAEWNPILRTGTPLTGRLLDIDGQPIEGWRISAQAREKTPRYAHATTDPDGRFHFDQLPDVEHHLRARPPRTPGRAGDLVWGERKDVRPGGAPVTLQLAHRFEDGGFVTGRMLAADGRGLTGGRVMFDAPSFGRQVLDAHADDGLFRVGPVPRGHYRITIQDGSGGFLQAGRHEVPAAGDLDLGELQLAATSRIAVFLDHPTGADVRASLVAHSLRGGGGSLTFTRRADGAYVSGPLRPGRHGLTIRGERIAPASLEVEVVAGRDTEVRVPVIDAAVVTLEVDGPSNDSGSVDYVFVHVTDPAGQKLFSQLLTLPPGTQGGSLRQGFAPGNYTLRAESPKRELVGTHPFVVPGGGEPMKTSVTMRPK